MAAPTDAFIENIFGIVTFKKVFVFLISIAFVFSSSYLIADYLDGRRTKRLQEDFDARFFSQGLKIDKLSGSIEEEKGTNDDQSKLIEDLKNTISNSASDASDTTNSADDGSLNPQDFNALLGSKEDKISSGLTTQYWRGDKTWQNLDTLAVLENSAGGLYWTQTRFDEAFSDKSTDDLAEGVNNLYFTPARARGALSSIGPITYDSSTGQIGLAYDSNNLKITGFELNTIQDISSLASPNFSGLTLSSLTTGSVIFTGEGGALSQDNNNLFWDNTNNRLGIGTSAPLYTLDVNGDMRISGNLSAPNVVYSISGTTGRITSTGGQSVVIDIDPNYVGQTSITTLGVIATGTWKGSTIQIGYGGTGLSYIGGADQLLGVNSTGSSLEYKNIASLLTSGTGISISGTTNLTVSNTGILSLVAGGGIEITPGQSPTISNTGVVSLNSLTGNLTLQGTSDQINVSSGGSTITLSLPQNIHVGATPTFSGLTISSLAPGSVLFGGVGGQLSQDVANLYWDNVNKRLGIGTASPSYTLDVGGTISTLGFRMPTGATAGYVLTSDDSGIGTWQPPSGGLPVGTSAQTLRHDGTNWVASGYLQNTGTLVQIGENGADGILRLYSEQGATDHVLDIVPSDTMSRDTKYMLPPDTGKPGQVLVTDGGGILNWGSPYGPGTAGFSVIKYKTADESYSGTTLQDDDHLFFDIGPKEVWVIMFNLSLRSPGPQDIKFAITAPSGAVCNVGVGVYRNNVSSVSNIACGVSTGLIATTGVDEPIIVFATIQNDSNAGTVRLQWAQYSAGPASTIYRGSYMQAFRVNQ